MLSSGYLLGSTISIRSDYEVQVSSKWLRAINQLRKATSSIRTATKLPVKATSLAREQPNYC